MTNLTIRSLEDPTLTATLVRDVCHVHPQWVHDQLGTGSESELQSFLDSTSIDEYLDVASLLKRWQEPAEAADDLGIYYAGPLYRVSSEYRADDGTRCWNDTAEALGDYAFRFFADEDEAQAASDDLASDLDDGSTVTYSVEKVR